MDPWLTVVERLNSARHENPALSGLSTIAFVEMANDALPAYAKRSRGNSVITVVNVDSHLTQEGLAIVTAPLGLPPSIMVHDVLFDECFQRRTAPNYVRVEPCMRRAHIHRVEV